MAIGSRTRAGEAIERREHDYAEDELRQPKVVSDPHTTTDETQQSWRDWAGNNWKLVASMAGLGTILLIAITIVIGPFFVTLATNPLLHRVLFVAGIFGVGGKVGWNIRKSRVEDRWTFIAYNPENGTSVRYQGEAQQGKYGDYWVFKPIKGYTRFGLMGEQYSAAELSPNLPDMPATIRLWPAMTSVITTDTGNYLVQRTDGIAADPDGNETNLVATLPSKASESVIEELTEALDDAKGEISSLNRQLTAAHQQMDDLAEIAELPRQELLDEIGSVAEILEAFTPHSAASGRQGESGLRNSSVEDHRERLGLDRE